MYISVGLTDKELNIQISLSLSLSLSLSEKNKNYRLWLCDKSRGGAHGSYWMSDQWLWRKMSKRILKVLRFSIFSFIFISTTPVARTHKALWNIHTNFWLMTVQCSEFPLYANAFSLELAALESLCSLL